MEPEACYSNVTKESHEVTRTTAASSAAETEIL